MISRARIPTPGVRIPRRTCCDIVAGIRPDAAAYGRVRIAPVLGHLTSLDATAVTPQGAVKVSYRVEGDQLHAVIDRPADLPGTFVWRGKSYPLPKARTTLQLPL